MMCIAKSYIQFTANTVKLKRGASGVINTFMIDLSSNYLMFDTVRGCKIMFYRTSLFYLTLLTFIVTNQVINNIFVG